MGLGLLAMLLASGLTGQVHAAAFFAGRLDGAEIVAQTNRAWACYEVRYADVRIDIAEGRATTTLDLTVIGGAEDATAFAVIPLGAGAEPVVVQSDAEAKVLGAAETRALCRTLAEKLRSAAILSLAGNRSIVIPNIRIGASRHIVLSWAQNVPVDRDVWNYACPLPLAALSGAPVKRLATEVRLSGSKPIRGLYSPTHEMQVQRSDPRQVLARSVQEDCPGTAGFRLFYALDEGPVGMRLLTYRDPAVEEDGYFLLFGCPSGSTERRVQPKDIAFVLDSSGSMRGEKFEQAQCAVENCLRKLNPGDRFNLIAFGTEVRRFRPDFVAGDAATLKAATAFMDETPVTGRTNIGEALRRGAEGDPEPGRMRMMVFLTDGTPTEGERLPAKVLEDFAAVNKARVQVFVFGLGHDVNAHLLDRLAESTDGSIEYVAPEEDVDVKVAALYDRLNQPFLTDVALDFGGMNVTSVFPKRVPALFLGGDLVVAGRYKTGGHHTIVLSGQLNGTRQEYRQAVDIPDAGGGVSNRMDFVATLWATRKIGFLSQEIRLHGQNDELIAEVVRLSRQYGVVTEYTAFLADADGSLTPEKAVETVRNRMKEANEQQTGQWAVNQAANDQALQKRMAVSDSFNSFRDSRGDVQSNAKVRMLGRRALYWKNGQWEDSESAGSRTTRTVKAFSKEFFDLAADNDDFRRAVEVGGSISINLANERIVVEK